MKSLQTAKRKAGGGEVARLIEQYDWSSTSVGPMENWSPGFRAVTSLVQHSDVPMCLMWGQDAVLIFNDAYWNALADRRPVLLGASAREAWPESADFLDTVMQTVLGGGSLSYKNREFTLYRKGRPEQAWLNMDYSPVLDDDGRPCGVLGIIVETTEEVLAAYRIWSEQQRQKRMFQQMPGFAALLMGPDFIFEYANDAYYRVANRTELIGRRLRDVFPELESQGIFERIQHAYTNGETVMMSRTPYQLDGQDEVHVAEFVFEPLRDDDGAVIGIFLAGYEVTEVYRAAEALQASEARLIELNAGLEREILRRTHVGGKVWSLTPAALTVLTLDGVLEDVNPAWTALLDWTRDETIDRRLLDFIHDDDKQRLADNLARLVDGENVLGCECRVLRKTGGHRWLSWFAVPDEGRVYASARDVTAAKEAEAELARTQDALRQAQKMEAVGQLTGGLAHDFNNLLNGITGSLEVLETRISEGRLEGLEKYIGIAQTAASRAASLTQRLLAFSRRQTLDPRPTDLNDLVAGMADLCRRTVGPAISVEVASAADLWPTRVDPAQTESALLNLVINARDAMPDGGRITIQTANSHIDEAKARTVDLPPGDYVCLSVSDTGSGIPPDVLDRVFDPFFTTKPTGQGAGLGLSMVHGFVNQSGGRINIHSEVGRGTTMTLCLPRHDAPITAEASAPELPGATAPLPGQTVLVIDDEIAIRMLIVEVLEEAGYQVLDAADGPSGLSILQSPVSIDLLVSDVGLPGGLNGRQVADAARLGRPDLKVLFITGYAESAAIGDNQLEAGMQVMTKPFAMRSLVARVRSIVEAG